MMMMNPGKPQTRSTLHRALTALPHDDLMGLAEQYGLDPALNRVDIEYSLLSQDYAGVARKTLTLMRKRFDEEKP